MYCPLCPNYKEQPPIFGWEIINGVKVPSLLNNPDNTPCEKHALEFWTQQFAEPPPKDPNSRFSQLLRMSINQSLM